MNLEDQLSELRFNVLRDRSDIVAGDTDSLWSDETLIRYIKDAERRFARRTLILRDGTTPEIVRVRVRTGVNAYPLHESVIAVISARFDTNQYDMQRSGHAIVTDSKPPEFLSFDPSVEYTTPPGTPQAYYTDETMVYGRQGKVTLMLYPIPDAAADGKTMNLRVIRVPATGYSLECLDRESEIPEDYQLDVLEWAAYRAQRGFDADAGAPTSADAHKKAFDEAVDAATKELKRAMFASTGLRYGMNGFSWDR